MNNKMKVTGLLLGGYLLGRTKKLKLAMTVVAAASGSTAYKNRGQLQEALGKLGESSPELKELQEKITGRLADSGRGAASAVVATGVDTLSTKLKEQTDKLNASIDGDSQQADSDEEEEPAEDGEEAPAEDGEEEPAEDGEEEPAEDGEEEPAEDEEEEPAEDEEKASAEESPAEETSSSTRGSSSSDSQAPTLAKGETKVIREWAQENDVEVSSRGRISKDVVRAYRNATKRASSGAPKQNSSTSKSSASSKSQGANK